MIASGTQTRVRSINAEGMKRRGFSSSAISSIKRAFKVIYRESGLLDQSLNELETTEADSPEVIQFINSIRSSKNGIMRGPTDE
jgi:UDP-N-acetylglucosamine acyltransferase